MTALDSMQNYNSPADAPSMRRLFNDAARLRGEILPAPGALYGADVLDPVPGAPETQEELAGHYAENVRMQGGADIGMADGDGETSIGGLMVSLTPAAMQALRLAEDQEDEDDIRDLLEQARQEMLEALELRLKALLEEIENLDERYRDIARNIADLDRRTRALDEYADALEDGAPVERDAQGRLKSKIAEEALKAYEAKYGKVDRNDPAAVLAAIRDTQLEWERERQRLEAEKIENREKREEKVKEAQEKALEADTIDASGTDKYTQRVKEKEKYSEEEDCWGQKEPDQQDLNVESPQINIHYKPAAFIP